MNLFHVPDWVKISLDRKYNAKVMWSQFTWQFRIVWYGKKWRAWKRKVKEIREARLSQNS